MVFFQLGIPVIADFTPCHFDIKFNETGYLALSKEGWLYALNKLKNVETRKRISKDVSKTVKSAISNAENNYQFDIDNLFVKEAYVGKSLVMKRFRPRAKGRASPIKKPFSRITIVLEEKKENSY